MIRFKFYTPASQVQDEIQNDFLKIVEILGRKIGTPFDTSRIEFDHATYNSVQKFQNMDYSGEYGGYDYLIVKSLYNKSYLVFDVHNEKFYDVRL